MPSTIIAEGSAIIQASTEKKISKELEVFYNPVMQKNRDLSILLLLALKKKDMRIADPLAGSGIRALRFLKELPKNAIKEIYANDLKEDFLNTMLKNAKLSELTKEQEKKLLVMRSEANKFLLSNPFFDYIDVDPFGSPNPFLDTSIKRIFRGGILAVTATDTAPLCGTYPKACMRKYWAKPRRDFLMHEWGLRVLIRKCQLIGAQFDKALTPIFSYSLDHYFRVFFEVQQGKSKVDSILKQIGEVDGFGPAWLGSLGDADLVKSMRKESAKKKHDSFFNQYDKLLATFYEEYKLNSLLFYDIHFLSKTLKLGSPPRHDKVMDALKKHKFKVCKTHFSPTGIKTNAPKEELIQIITRVSEEHQKK